MRPILIRFKDLIRIKKSHSNDVIEGTMVSLVTSLTTVCSTVYSGADQRQHQTSASLAFVWGNHRWPVNSPHKWPVTRKMFQFDDVITKNWSHCLCAMNNSMVSSQPLLDYLWWFLLRGFTYWIACLNSFETFARQSNYCYMSSFLVNSSWGYVLNNNIWLHNEDLGLNLD